MNIKKTQHLEIKKISPNKNTEIIIIKGFGKAFGVNVDKSKNIYIPSFDKGLIYKISARFDHVEILDVIENNLIKIDDSGSTFPLKGSLLQPHDVEFDKMENMYITELGLGKVITRIGSDSNNGKGLDGPTVSHSGKDGFLYVSEWRANKILRYDSNNKITGWLGKYNNSEVKNNNYNFNIKDKKNTSSYLSGPHAIRVGPDHNLYVADSENHRVVKFSSNGKYMGWIGKRKDDSFNNNWSKDGLSAKGSELGAFDNLIDLEFVKDNFYITDHGNHRIIKMNLSGKAISWIGENTIKSNSMIWNKNGFSIKSNSPIGLNHPFGLKIKNKKIYIADRGNNRIKVIKSNLIN